jgi:aspartate-semialdehyde dehydrogenase
MKSKPSITVVGATGVVGRTMLQILEQRAFPVGELTLLASQRSAGSRLSLGAAEYVVQDLARFDFAGVDIALFSAGAAVSKQYAPKAVAAGCTVIDNTSQFRGDPDVPLVVPEVNPEALTGGKQPGIIANPNCSTIQMVVALKPLHDAAGIQRVNVATYQAVSGSGQQGIDELTRQATQLAQGKAAEANLYPRQIAYNLIPQIDVFTNNGYTKEEMKMVAETKKIFGDDRILVNPTAVRVPVANGHSEVLHIETRTKLSAEKATELLRQAAGVQVYSGTDYPTPAEVTGSDAVHVGRIREDITSPNGLNLWVVADNLHKGAALNSVQIAELLLATVL